MLTDYPMTSGRITGITLESKDWQYIVVAIVVVIISTPYPILLHTLYPAPPSIRLLVYTSIEGSLWALPAPKAEAAAKAKAKSSPRVTKATLFRL